MIVFNKLLWTPAAESNHRLPHRPQSCSLIPDIEYTSPPLRKWPRFVAAMWEESDDDEYDDSGTSSLLGVSSVGCQCIACQQRQGNCEMWTVRSGSIVMLPSADDDRWSLFQRSMVDKDSLQYLNEKRVINWCKGAYKLYPMKTTGNLVTFRVSRT